MQYYLNIINKGGLNTKLYKALRGDNSLCYNVSSGCYDRNNFFMVKTVIRPGTENKAIKLIKKCVNDMKSKISNEEFTGAYYLYQSGLKGMVDSIGAINKLYMNSYFSGFSTYEEKKEKFKKVTIDDINNLATKIKLNTIYVLKGDKNERNND
jgi:predicted Zn-dependent peptidase